MIVEIFNPQLNDFSESELRLMTEALLDLHHKKVEQIKSYTDRGELITMMFRNEISEKLDEVNSLQEILVQFAGALKQKALERQIQSN